MPAVSISRTVRPAHSNDVSMASLVVPGMSDTMVRSWPSSELTSELLPTFGRPMMATPTGLSSIAQAASSGLSASAAMASAGSSAACSALLRASSVSDSGGSDQTTTSSRSATPRPWSALIGWISGQPKAWNSAASNSRFGLSDLLTATTTGALAVRSNSFASWSAGVMPASASTTKTITSASSMATLRLLLDALLDRISGSRLEATRIDNDEAPAVPLADVVETVARSPRTILDDGHAVADDAVEERALADVGPADESDNGQTLRGRPIRCSSRCRAPGAPRRHGFLGRARDGRSRLSALLTARVVERRAAVCGLSHSRERGVRETLGLGAALVSAGQLVDALGDLLQVFDGR